MPLYALADFKLCKLQFTHLPLQRYIALAVNADVLLVHALLG